PEVLQTLCQVRLAKVDHEMETHELRAAAGDTAVAAEITINLPGKSVGPKDDGEGVRRTEVATKGGIGEERAIVRYHHLSKKALEDKHETVKSFCRIPLARTLHLWQEMGRPLDRTGD